MGKRLGDWVYGVECNQLCFMFQVVSYVSAKKHPDFPLKLEEAVIKVTENRHSGRHMA